MAPLARTLNLHSLLAAVVTAFLLACCATLPACDDKVAADVAKVKISGKAYYLELAINDAKRFRGLSERTHIDPTGGMLFVFPEVVVPRGAGFVMRDCPVDIDILYVDANGRVVSAYEMKKETPRDPTRGEGTPADAANAAYNSRLKQYVSKAPYQFVIELAAGSIKTLGVKEGDPVELDTKALTRKAQ